MKLTWYKKLFSGAGAVILTLYGVIGTVATILTISGSISIPIRVLSITALIVLAIVVTCIATIINCNKVLEEESQHPVHEFFTDDDDKKLIYIAYTSDIRTDALVALYSRIKDKPMPKRIGFGIVRNVYNEHEESYIEIEVLSIYDQYQELYEKALRNDKKILKNMYILPRIYKDSIPELARIIGGDCSAKG